MAKITRIEEVQPDRLTWPDHKPRAAHRIPSVFGKTEVQTCSQQIEWELVRWKAKRFRISRNNQRIFAGDPGASVWWMDRKDELRVLACDKYLTLAANLRAIYKTLDAMRALERWGAYTAEEAAEGARIALPPPEGASEIQWKAVFGEVPDGLEKLDALAIVNGRYRRLAAEAQADDAELRRLNLAIEQARRELTA